MDSCDTAACSSGGQAQRKCGGDDGFGVGRDRGRYGRVGKEGAVEGIGGVGFGGWKAGTERLTTWGWSWEYAGKDKGRRLK